MQEPNAFAVVSKTTERVCTTPVSGLQVCMIFVTKEDAEAVLRIQNDPDLEVRPMICLEV